MKHRSASDHSLVKTLNVMMTHKFRPVRMLEKPKPQSGMTTIEKDLKVTETTSSHNSDESVHEMIQTTAAQSRMKSILRKNSLSHINNSIEKKASFVVQSNSALPNLISSLKASRRKSSNVGSFGRRVSMLNKDNNINTASIFQNDRKASIMVQQSMFVDDLTTNNYQNFIGKRRSFVDQFKSKINKDHRKSLRRLTIVQEKQIETKKQTISKQRLHILEINRQLDLPRPEVKTIDPVNALDSDGRKIFFHKKSRSEMQENLRAVISSAYYRHIDDPFFKKL